MPHEFKAILDAPPELLAKVAPLMVVMVAAIIVGIGWLAFRQRKLRQNRRHFTPNKPRKKP
jgi:putative exporter of polyketide antibiotics